jgi:hypothetical protein
MRFFIGAGLMAFCAFTSGAAGVRAADTLITAFNEANLKDLIVSVGGTEVSLQKTDKITFYKYKIDGRTYLTFLDPCSEGETVACGGIQIGASFSGTFALESVNRFNSLLPMGRAHLTQAGTLVSTRYLTAMDGVTQEHLKSELKSLFTITDAMVVFFSKSGTVASAPPSTARLSFTPGTPSPFETLPAMNTIP